ncbi:MAG: ABC transporter permease [Acidobacteria bacterium]|nr:ABC transporter permease [Acidobacteriota bacterium]
MGIFRELRYALRSYLRAPGFAAVAVLTLALGIGGATAIFSVVDGILLRPLPYPEASRLVKLGRTTATGSMDGAFSAADFLDVRREGTSLVHVAGYREDISDLTGVGEPVRVPGVQTTAGFFDALGVTPLAGRVYTAADEARGGMAVISEGLWDRQFGRRSDVVGSQIRVNGIPTTIVGVVSASVRHPIKADLWNLAPGAVPTSPIPSGGLADREVQYFAALARLATGATMGDANAQLQAIGERLGQQFPETNRGESFHVRPLAATLVTDVRAGLLLLLGAVACVLLIACANVAGLMLARGLARRRELAVRAAIGASRWQIARQLMVEGLVLAAAGGAAGLILASWGVDLLVALAPQNLPRLGDIQLDWRVAGVASLATTAVGLLAGLAPVVQSSRPQVNEDLKDGGRTGTSIRTRFRSGLVVAEVALALILMIGAGLMATSLARLRAVDPGFHTTSMAAVDLPVPQSRYDGPAQGRFYSEVLGRLQDSPVTARSALVFPLPLRGSGASAAFDIEGRPSTGRPAQPIAELNIVSPDFFQTMGLRLVRGRGLASTDVEGRPPVVIINERLAREFGSEDPVGRRINLGDWITVVGVVSDARRESLAAAPQPALYLPYQQFVLPYMSLVVRTDASEAAVASAVKSVVRELDPDLPVETVRTIDQIVEASTDQPRFRTTILLAFSFLAVLLAAVGVYGLMSFSVSQRTSEMGVRLALGASPGQVGRLVLRQGLALAGLGVALGLAAAAGGGRLVASLLFDTSATDPAIYAGLAALLLTVAALACYVPARRAMRVDPMRALRAD